jgi:hypothetical protein
MRQPLVLHREVVVVDGPSLCAPAGAVLDNYQEIRAFELYCEGRLLGVLAVSPTPVATFTSEGGFRASEDYPWTSLNEEELLDRLQKLMEANQETSRAETPFAV